MANDPVKSNQKRGQPPRKENSQAEHEGSAHTPDEFDAMNPERVKDKPKGDITEQN